MYPVSSLINFPLLWVVGWDSMSITVTKAMLLMHDSKPYTIRKDYVSYCKPINNCFYKILYLSLVGSCIVTIALLEILFEAFFRCSCFTEYYVSSNVFRTRVSTRTSSHHFRSMMSLLFFNKNKYIYFFPIGLRCLSYSNMRLCIYFRDFWHSNYAY